jgi:hypothetical protein
MSNFYTQGTVPLDSPARVSRVFETKVLQSIYGNGWVLLLGPRQHGKTTGLIRINQELVSFGYLTVFVDLQGLSSANTYEEFLEIFSRKTVESLETKIQQRPEGTDLSHIVYWLEKIIPDGIQPVVIIIDEASAIKNAEWRNTFYSQIRSIKTEQALPKSSKLVKRLRFIFSGCFRPDTLVQTLNSPFNACEEIDTEDLTIDQVIELYSNVTNRTDMSLIENTYNIVGGIPYLLQWVFSQVHEVPNDRKEDAFARAIEALYSGHDNHFQFLFQKICEDDELKKLVSELVLKSHLPNDPADTNYKYLRTLGLAKLEGKVIIFRNHIYKKLVEDSALFRQGSSTTEEGPKPNIQYVIHGAVEVTGTKISVTNSTTGNIIASSVIEDSLNTIKSSNASEEIKKTLIELGKAVEEMVKKLSESDAEEVREDFYKLSEEANKKSPRPKWYDVSIEGLQKAAKNLGEIGIPVLELAAKIAVLLGRLS